MQIRLSCSSTHEFEQQFDQIKDNKTFSNLPIAIENNQTGWPIFIVNNIKKLS